MKLLFTTTLLLFGIALLGQYNYGLEVEQQDVKIEGRLYLENGNKNISIGRNAGYHTTYGLNVFIGSNAGYYNTAGSGNTFIGWQTGFNNTIGRSNTFLGRATGHSNTTGEGNSFLGMYAGWNNSTGSDNTFLGYGSGNTIETGSFNLIIGAGAGPTRSNSDQDYRLYIDVFDGIIGSDNPLIFGEFDNHKAGINWNSSIPLPATLSINGTLHISETAKLEPQAGPPTTCTATENGLMYYDSSVAPNKLKLCTDVGWVDLN